MMDRRGFLKGLLGFGAVSAAGLVLPDVEPVRRFWQVGANAPVAAREPAFERYIARKFGLRMQVAEEAFVLPGDPVYALGDGTVTNHPWEGSQGVRIGHALGRNADGTVNVATTHGGVCSFNFKPRVINVPRDYPSLTSAFPHVRPGDTVLSGPGHTESINIPAPRFSFLVTA